jgi:hypothetical protein
MAAKVVNLNLLDLFTDEGQAALERVLADPSVVIDSPSTEQNSAEQKQGWFVRVIGKPVVNGFKAAPLTTAFVNILKSPYAHQYLPRENSGGNFCGHDPAAPRFVMQNHAYFTAQDIDDLGCKRRPQILYDIVERIKGYYYDTEVIPALHTANAHKRSSDRQRRSESREAVVNLLSVMIMYMDLSSFRIGLPLPTGGFFSYSLEWLAGKAKLSLDRAKNALSDLNDSMIISSTQRRELINEERKEYKAYNATRIFDIEFFRMLEIDEQKLGKARKISTRKKKYQEKEFATQQSKKADAVAKLQMKKMMKLLDPEKKVFTVPQKIKDSDELAEEKRLKAKRTAIVQKLSQDPQFRNDGDALRKAVQLHLKVMGLLTDKEKLSMEQDE